MLGKRFAALTALTVGALLVPATGAVAAGNPQITQLCHSKLGSGTIVVGPVATDRCVAATYGVTCTVKDPKGKGICVMVDLPHRKVGVAGVVIVRLL